MRTWALAGDELGALVVLRGTRGAILAGPFSPDAPGPVRLEAEAGERVFSVSISISDLESARPPVILSRFDGLRMDFEGEACPEGRVRARALRLPLPATARVSELLDAGFVARPDYQEVLRSAGLTLELPVDEARFPAPVALTESLDVPDQPSSVAGPREFPYFPATAAVSHGDQLVVMQPGSLSIVREGSIVDTLPIRPSGARFTAIAPSGPGLWVTLAAELGTDFQSELLKVELRPEGFGSVETATRTLGYFSDVTVDSLGRTIVAVATKTSGRILLLDSGAVAVAEAPERPNRLLSLSSPTVPYLVAGEGGGLLEGTRQNGLVPREYPQALSGIRALAATADARRVWTASHVGGMTAEQADGGLFFGSELLVLSDEARCATQDSCGRASLGGNKLQDVLLLPTKNGREELGVLVAECSSLGIVDPETKLVSFGATADFGPETGRGLPRLALGDDGTLFVVRAGVVSRALLDSE